MSVYNVLIADDEPFIRNGLEKYFKESRKEFRIVCVCQNGAEAIGYLHHNLVDIALLDINMPEKTGLDVARYIKNNNLFIKVIIITGFRDFEYARAAIENSVNSFLLKPISFDKLSLALDDAKNLLDIESRRITQNTEFLRENRRKERSIISLLLSKSVSADKFRQLYISSFPGSDILDKKCTILNFSSINELGQLININENVYIDIGEDKNDGYDSFFVKTASEAAFFILFFNVTELSDITALENSFFEYLFRAMKKNYSIKIKLNYSKRLDTITDFDNENTIEQNSENYVNNLILGNDEMLGNITDIIDKTYKPDQCVRFWETVNSLMMHTVGTAPLKSENYLSTANHVNEICDNILRNCVKHQNNSFIDIIKYININYNNNISLDVVADKFNISTGHLSRMFKEKTGQNFTDYLTKIKLNKARELLLTKKYTVEEVSDAVGYASVKYFYRIFKASFGMTPREFVQMN